MEEMMNVREVGKVLGVSPSTVIDLIQAGSLPAYRVMGGAPVDRKSVGYTTTGLRIKPSDLREFLSNVLVVN